MSHALYPAYRLKRHKLLVSCATLAITVAVTPQRAWAQAFQGVPTTVAGTVTYASGTPGSDTITTGSAFPNSRLRSLNFWSRKRPRMPRPSWSFEVGRQIKFLVLLLLAPAVCWVIGWVARR